MLRIEGLGPYIMFALCFEYRVYIGPGVENGFSVILFSWIVRGRTKTSYYNTPLRLQIAMWSSKKKYRYFLFQNIYQHSIGIHS